MKRDPFLAGNQGSKQSAMAYESHDPYGRISAPVSFDGSVTHQSIRPDSRVAARTVAILSWTFLGLLTLFVWCLYGISERWWVGTAFTYLPKVPLLAPVCGLLVASLFWHRRSLWVNVVSLIVVLVPAMGLSIPVSRLLGTPPVDEEFQISIVSCNVQAFKPNFELILDEIRPIRPDVIVLQEAFPLSPLLESEFRDWHSIHHDHYWVGSRFPLKLLVRCDTIAFDRTTGLVVELETPGGPVVVGDIHLMTSRRGLSRLDRSSIFDGSGAEKVEKFQVVRNAESEELRNMIESVRGDKPVILAGDFNAPSSSSFFQEFWSDYQNAFDSVGFGYGYSYPASVKKYWPKNCPWVRIDHVLASHEWTVRTCQVGKSAGSDHRLIAAKLSLSFPMTNRSNAGTTGIE